MPRHRRHIWWDVLGSGSGLLLERSWKGSGEVLRRFLFLVEVLDGLEEEEEGRSGHRPTDGDTDR